MGGEVRWKGKRGRIEQEQREKGSEEEEEEEEEKSPVCAVLLGLPSSPLNFAECQYPGLGTGS